MNGKQTRWLVGAAVLAMSGTALAQGKIRERIEEKVEHHEQVKHEKENQQACQDLQQFKTSIAQLDQAGPQTTVGELQQNAKQARQDFKRFEKAARKAAKPEAENVEQMAEKLRKDANSIPKGATVAQAREMLRSDMELVRMASNHLEQKLNCGVGGAGMEGIEEPGMEGQSQEPGMEGQREPPQQLPEDVNPQPQP